MEITFRQAEIEEAEVLSYYSDWKKFTLITPADKEENVKFYTEKCHFDIEGIEMDGNVKVYRFVRDRSWENNA